MEPQSNADQQPESHAMGMQIDIGHLSATGNVVIAGRDGIVHVNTGGNVDQQTTQSITVGGIETTREAFDQMVSKIRELESKIQDDDLDDETREAAEYDLKTIEEQLTATKKPNAKILVKAARALYRISPMLASGVFALFGEPLASQIMVGVGGLAMQFLEVLMKRHQAK